MKGPSVFLAGCLLVCCSTARGDFTTIINVPPQAAPSSIGSNTQLNLAAGGSLPANFLVGDPNGSSTNIEVNITGGTVGNRFTPFAGSTINVSGGNIGARFWPHDGSTANITGGTFGRDLTCEMGSEVYISGGLFPYEVHAMFRSKVNVFGGAITHFQAHDEAEPSFYGRQFFVDGVELTNLVPGEPTLIDERDVSFSGVLADGSPFSFELISAEPDQGGADVDHFALDAILMVTLVPRADFDHDIDVDGADLAMWETAYGVNGTADADGDGDSDGNDFLLWQSQYTGSSGDFIGATAVPEPASVAFLLAAGISASIKSWPRPRRPCSRPVR